MCVCVCVLPYCSECFTFDMCVATAATNNDVAHGFCGLDNHKMRDEDSIDVSVNLVIQGAAVFVMIR